MRSFAAYYQLCIVKPTEAFENLIHDKRLLKFSAAAVSITAVLYTLVYVFLIFGGGMPFKPWLDIPPGVYYRYNVFFCAPSMFLAWILSSGVVHLLSRLLTQMGSFEQTVSVLGFGISIASWTTGIHDVVSSFAGALHLINQHDFEISLNSPTIWRSILWILMTAYLVWFIILFTKGVKTVYKIRKSSAFVPGITGFIIYQFFFFVFNR